MENTIQTLCQLFREHLDIPVFESALPENISTPCIVIKEEPSNSKDNKNEFHINVYAPNKLRVFGNISDNTYPDIEQLENWEKQVLSVSKKAFFPTNPKIHVRKFIKERDMHYMNICIVVYDN